MPKIADRVKETTTTTGTGTYSLAGAVTGFQAFSSAFVTTDSVYYCVENGTDWETGYGTLTTGTPWTLTRASILASSNASAAVNWGAGTKNVFCTVPAVAPGLLGREVLTAARTYYVRTDGSDSNNGLANTAGGAFLTIQKAVDVIAATLDLYGYDVTIQVADGTYTGAVTISDPWVGKGIVTIQGNSGTPANVLISTGASDCFVANTNATVILKNFKLTNTGSYGIRSRHGSYVSFSGLNFGAINSYQLRAEGGGVIEAIGNYSITGGAAYHMASTGSSLIRIQSRTVTITGTPNFTNAFAIGEHCSVMFVNGNTYSGSATGTRYSVTTNGVVYTNAGGATYLPGNVAGTTATGGQYV